MRVIKRTVAIWALLLAALALAACGRTDEGGDGGGGETSDGTTISCEVQVSVQQPFDPATPIPDADSEFPAPEGRGIDFARTVCDDPVGAGAQYDEFVIVPEEMPPPTGVGGLRFTMYTELGSIDGVWDVSFAANNPCEFNFEIDEVTWIGGTGAYEGVEATGSGSGEYTDIQNTPNCRAATFEYEVDVSGLPEDPAAAFADVETTDGEVSCEAQLSAQQPFDPATPIPDADAEFPAPEGRAIDFARVVCDAPIGAGAQYDEFVLVPGGEPPPPDAPPPSPDELPPPGDGGLRFTQYTEQGSIDGVYAVSFDPTGPCEFNFEIEVTLIGGTGAFADIGGSGSGTGDFTDTENAPICAAATFEYDLNATGLPAG